jgi:hypothetical protein
MDQERIWSPDRAGEDGVRVQPVRLNATVAWLFMVGSACFVLASIPAYLNATGGWVDGITYFVGSLFFTAASAGQLLQAQTPSMTDVDAVSQHARGPVRWWAWRPHDRSWSSAATQFPGTLLFNVSTLAALAHNATAAESNRHVWRPDMYGSTLFLVASAFGVLAAGSARSWSWRIAWLNMLGSLLFMASALASYVLPSGELVSTRVSVAGTLLGALCFLVGAALMMPAWRAGVRPERAEPDESHARGRETRPHRASPSKETP